MADKDKKRYRIVDKADWIVGETPQPAHCYHIEQEGKEEPVHNRKLTDTIIALAWILFIFLGFDLLCHVLYKLYQWVASLW